MDKKVALIIGIGGFVGEYLAKALISKNYDVYGTKLSFENAKINNVNIIDLNICSFDDTKKAIESINPDYIFHLAAISSVAISWNKPQETINVNVIGAINVLESIKTNNKVKIILIGSSEEYGIIDYSKPIKEETYVNPMNVYSVSKFTQEQLGKIYHKAYGLNVCMTRSFNHIGPGQLPQFVVSDFCKQVAEIENNVKDPIIYVGNLEAKRDFTDVRDVVDAYILIAENGLSGEVYNVGSGKSISIKEILNMIISFSSINIDVQIDKNKMRPIDIPDIICDNTKLNSLGWNLKHSIEDTIKDTLNYWRKKND